MLGIRPFRQTMARRDTARLSLALRDGAGWQGFVLIALGWSGIGLAYALVDLARDSASDAVVICAAAVSVASLAAVGRGAGIAYAAARSPIRHVFHSRVLLRTGATLLTIAAIALASLIARAPFEGMAAHGEPPAELMSDLTFVAASLMCGFGGLATLGEAWKSRHDERAWRE